MRSLLLTAPLLVALALPAVSAAHVHGATDGTLSIRDGRGKITMSVRGGVIGSFAAGSVTITDPIDGDGTGPIVSGNNWSRERSVTTTSWGGTKVRFRIIGGAFRVVVRGRGINLSLIGKGNVKLEGAGTDNDGSYSVNGGDYSPIPDLFAFPLSATSP
jgi:hypothetical protein